MLKLVAGGLCSKPSWMLSVLTKTIHGASCTIESCDNLLLQAKQLVAPAKAAPAKASLHLQVPALPPRVMQLPLQLQLHLRRNLSPR